MKLPFRTSKDRAEPASIVPDVAAFRQMRLEQPLRPYEALLSSDRWVARRVSEADLILSEGWKRGKLPRVSLAPPIAWETICSSNRSWEYHLHAWEPMALLLSGHQHLGDSRYVDFCLALALDWSRRFPSTDVEHGFAWYDMAIGVRAYRLGYLLDVVARDEAYADDAVAELMRSAAIHGGALLDDDRFVWHGNHGLYQAAGQVALAARFPELPEMPAGLEQGRERLAIMVRSQFAEDGVHVEHSPGYHYLLLDTLERVLEAELLDDAAGIEIAHRAQEALAWFVMPDGRIAMIGDTSNRMVRNEPFDESDNSALRFVATAGAAGDPPARRMQVFDASGYVVMRDRWPSGADDFDDCAYLAQIAAFHSRAHKHADDFSFVWFDRGRELIVDSGRYGYLGRIEASSELGRQGFTYSDPNRIYVESTRAHNTVEIDGRSHPRRVEPYGSGLRSCGDTDGVMYSECAAVFHERIEHRRVLAFRPRSWVVIVDALSDPHREPHSFSQRFHFAPELDAASHGESVAAQLPDTCDRLWMTPLVPGATLQDVVRGRSEPDLLGFVSYEQYEMVPTTTAAFRVAGVSSHVFATLLCLSEAKPVPDEARCVLSANGREGSLRWSVDGSPELLLLAVDVPSGRLRLSYRGTSG